MMKLRVYLPLIGLAALAAGCGDKAATNVAAANATAPAADNAAAPAVQTAKGTGTVKSIDKAAGTITLDHDAIAEIGWPAMTMRFTAAPALLDGVQVGDKVGFGLKVTDGAGEVTSIARR